MFQITIGASIKSAFREEFMIKGLVPHQGFGVLYGASQSLKSFVALDMAYRVALGESWGGRRVVKADTIYVAAEGMGGMAKRVEGIRAAHSDWPNDVSSFGLLCGCPNLGLSAPKGDLAGLVESIESSGLRPRLIVLDTLAQMICGADENGSGMTAFVRNAQALSHRFGCFVLAVHHIGYAAEQRLTRAFKPARRRRSYHPGRTPAGRASDDACRREGEGQPAQRDDDREPAAHCLGH